MIYKFKQRCSTYFVAVLTITVMLLLSSSSKTVTYLTPFKHPSSLSTVNILLLDFYLVSLTSSLNRFLIKFSELDQKSEILAFYGIPVFHVLIRKIPLIFEKQILRMVIETRRLPLSTNMQSKIKKTTEHFQALQSFVRRIHIYLSYFVMS